jgi:hypothetical protein
VTRLLAFFLMLTAASAANAVSNFVYLHVAKGIAPAVCYLVGFDADTTEWYGVCEITDKAGPYARGTTHNELVYWSDKGEEKRSKPCGADCPAQPAGTFDTYYLSGEPIPIYVVGTELDTGVVGGNGLFKGTAMLLLP